MRDTKRRIEPFAFFDRAGMEEKLTKMAAKGWMIERVSTFGWIYRKAEPKKLVFSITYYPKASEFDPEPSEEQRTFHEFCAHTGWQLACASAQMQIFYNENETPTPIETDPMLELDTLHRAAKKNILPGNLVLLALGLFNAAMFISRLLGDPIGVLASPTSLFTGFCWALLLIFCLSDIGGYYLWRSKAQKAAERGEFLTAHSNMWLRRGILWALLLVFFYWLVSILFAGSPLMRFISVTMFVAMFATLLLVNGIKQLLKARHAPRNVNRTITMAASFVLSLALMSGVVYFGLWGSSSGYFTPKDVETYEYNGMNWEIHLDQLPLTVEDLLNVEYEGYIRERRGEESLFASQFHMRQRPRYDAADYKAMPDLEYTITYVKMASLYDFCKKGLLGAEKDDYFDDGTVFIDHYEPIDATPWAAVEAYQHHFSDSVLNKYLLCYENTFIEISFSWEPTPEQMAMVAEKIGGISR